MRRKPFRFQNRRDGLDQRYDAIRPLDGQHFQIAPDRRRPADEFLFRKPLLECGQVVFDPQRLLATAAKLVGLVLRIPGTAIGALEMGDEIHVRGD